MAVVWNQDTLLFAKEIEPLIDKKTKKASKQRFPVSLNYRDPKEGDPWGLCLYDVAEDKQKIKTLMLNLMRIKAVNEALG